MKIILKNVLRKILQFTDGAYYRLFYKNLQNYFTKSGFIFLAVSLGAPPYLFLFMEILERAQEVDEIVSEDIETILLDADKERFKNLKEEELEGLKEREKAHKLNNAFWVGLAFLVAAKIILKLALNS